LRAAKSRPCLACDADRPGNRCRRARMLSSPYSYFHLVGEAARRMCCSKAAKNPAEVSALASGNNERARLMLSAARQRQTALPQPALTARDESRGKKSRRPEPTQAGQRSRQANSCGKPRRQPAAGRYMLASFNAPGFVQPFRSHLRNPGTVQKNRAQRPSPHASLPRAGHGAATLPAPQRAAKCERKPSLDIGQSFSPNN